MRSCTAGRPEEAARGGGMSAAGRLTLWSLAPHHDGSRWRRWQTRTPAPCALAGLRSLQRPGAAPAGRKAAPAQQPGLGCWAAMRVSMSCRTEAEALGSLLFVERKAQQGGKMTSQIRHHSREEGQRLVRRLLSCEGCTTCGPLQGKRAGLSRPQRGAHT